jgi:RND family efflux transporter MFP subunit
MMRVRNALLKRLLVMALIACAAAGCSKKEQNTKNSEIKPVIAGKVKIMDIPVFFSATGTVVPVHDVVISAEVSGKILEKPVEEGDNISKGDVIFKIDPADFQSRVEQAQAVMKQALSLQSQALRNVETNQPLLEKRIIAPDQYANLLNRKEEADGKVEQATAALKISKKALANTSISSTMESGVIVELYCEEGEYATAGMKVARIVDLSQVYVELQVPEGRIRHVSKGEQTAFKVSAYDQEFIGRVHSIVPFADIRSRTFKVKIFCQNPDNKLKAGMFAVARMKNGIREKALALPVTAVKTIGAKHWVYQVMELEEYNKKHTDKPVKVDYNLTDQKIFIAVEHPVKLGASYHEMVEILSGVENDMVVVVTGTNVISDKDILGIEDRSQPVQETKPEQ